VRPNDYRPRLPGLYGIKVFEKSGFETAAGNWQLCECQETGDFGWILTPSAPIAGAAAPFSSKKQMITGGSGLKLFPATWENLLTLKNLILEHDPGSTIFPTATGTLQKKSLGIGARFTTMHYPAVCRRTLQPPPPLPPAPSSLLPSTIFSGPSK
jgi:hypothetical protein